MKLDFEDLPVGTVVTTQYAARGVFFPFGALLESDVAAHSGSKILRTGDPAGEFNPGPFVIEFTSGQQLVRLYAGGTSGTTINGTLRAFDVNAQQLGSDGPKPVAPDAFTTTFEINIQTESIRRVEFQMDGSVFEAIDDLEFDGAPPADLPTTPPTVTLSNPVDGVQVTDSNLLIAGQVSGDGLLPQATLRIHAPRPPDSQAPDVIMPVTLSGSGTTRAFSLNWNLDLGPNSVTVEAENIAGLKAHAVAEVTYLPAPIRARYTHEGGATTFGGFQFGAVDGDCVIAIYQHGAIALRDNLTQLVRGAIFNKWLSLRDHGAFVPRLGCPLGAERSALAGSTAQDFRHGRVYAGLPTGAHFVPEVFVNAIEHLGGESETGIPTADPSDSIGAERTWLFQQFARPDKPYLLPSTLEIRGTPPQLLVERQGGYVYELNVAELPQVTGKIGFLRVHDVGTGFGPPHDRLDAEVIVKLQHQPTKAYGFQLRPGDNLAASEEMLAVLQDAFRNDRDVTIAYVFEPGKQNSMMNEVTRTELTDIPIDAPLLPEAPTVWYAFDCQDSLGPCSVALPTSGSPVEDAGERYCNNTIWPSAPEWVAIEDDYAVTPIFGVVESSYPSSSDNPLTHENYGDPPSFPSDWNVFVRPLNPYRNLLVAGRQSMELEFERYFAQTFFAAYGWPTVGNLLFAAGRWIIDCGHNDYHSEIHPPFVMVHMKTTTFKNRPATEANIWVNGFYSGAPTQFDIWPPPRPSAHANLGFAKPNDSDTALDVTVESHFEPAVSPHRIQVRFTASNRHVSVTDDGEMMWEAGRGYYGRWYVFWDD